MVVAVGPWSVGLTVLLSRLVNLKQKLKDIPGGPDGKESAGNAGDLGLIPGSGRSPGEENGYPLQYSCPEK